MLTVYVYMYQNKNKNIKKISIVNINMFAYVETADGWALAYAFLTWCS